jgi:hypothetical protein
MRLGYDLVLPLLSFQLTRHDQTMVNLGSLDKHGRAGLQIWDDTPCNSARLGNQHVEDSG